MLNFRSPPDLTSALDRAIAAEPEQPSRSEFIRRLLTDHLRSKGYLNAEPPRG